MRLSLAITASLGLASTGCEVSSQRGFSALSELNRTPVTSVIDRVGGTNEHTIITVSRSYDWGSGHIVKRSIDEDGLVRAERWELAYPVDAEPTLSDHRVLYEVDTLGVAELYRSILETQIYRDRSRDRGGGSTLARWHFVGERPIVVSASQDFVRASSIGAIITLSAKIENDTLTDDDLLLISDDIPGYVNSELLDVSSALHGRGMMNFFIEMLDQAGIGFASSGASPDCSFASPQ